MCYRKVTLLCIWGKECLFPSEGSGCVSSQSFGEVVAKLKFCGVGLTLMVPMTWGRLETMQSCLILCIIISSSEPNNKFSYSLDLLVFTRSQIRD